MGMPGKRVASIQGLARAIIEERIRLSDPWPALDAALATLGGFGPWTRSYLGIRLGRDPDAFAQSDLGLIRAAGASSPAELLRMAEAWRPYRAHAATYLWSVEAS
jgi:3-methyladenine DNA glycosylase/8-oxoguanine DNA glycosylase